MTHAELRYPVYPVRLKKESSRTLIFDFIRRRWLTLTPEEWVRQHLLNYLITVRGVPASLISIEKELTLNGTRKRYDVVVFDRAMKPWLVAECKAPYIAIDQAVIEQALRYNLVMKASHILLTNGVAEHIYDAAGKSVEFPAFAAVTT